MYIFLFLLIHRVIQPTILSLDSLSRRRRKALAVPKPFSLSLSLSLSTLSSSPRVVVMHVISLSLYTINTPVALSLEIISSSSLLLKRPFWRPHLAGNSMVWKLRPFLHLPRLVKHERRGDEHDAEANRGVSSPVFRVREPPAVRGPHLRRVERSSRRRTASSHFLTSESSSSV